MDFSWFCSVNVCLKMSQKKKSRAERLGSETSRSHALEKVPSEFASNLHMCASLLRLAEIRILHVPQHREILAMKAYFGNVVQLLSHSRPVECHRQLLSSLKTLRPNDAKSRRTTAACNLISVLRFFGTTVVPRCVSHS